MQTPPATSTPPSNKALTLREAVDEFQGQLASRRDEFAPALPAHISPERFQRVVVTAANLNPDLLRANRLSLFNACAKAASDGLVPDGRDGALVIFNTKEKFKGEDGKDRERYIQKVQWMPMIAGIIKKARQSGEISALGARIVYAKELEGRGFNPVTGEPIPPRFEHKVIDGVPTVNHDPILWGERGPMVLVYSYVRFKDGTTDFEFLHADDVAKIRNVSRAKDYGPWKDWTEEMWKKSAIRRHAKRLPISSELFDTIARDDEMTEFEKQRREAETKMLASARQQLGAPVGEIIEQGTEEPDTETEGDEPGEFEEADANPLADMPDEMLQLANCISVGAVERLEKEVGATIVGKGTQEQLVAWDQACAARAAELMQGKRK